MASTQNGTGGLTTAGQAADAAAYITIPSGAIVESLDVNPGGSPQFEDIQDENGAFHTRITFEKGMHTAQIVIVGKPYTKQAGEVDGSSSNYYVESVAKQVGKSAVRTTITVTRLPTIA